MNTILFAFALCSMATLPVNAGDDVTAKQVNGTWRYRQNEFKIWALGEQKLQIEFSGIFEYKNAYGPTANTARTAESRRSKATL
jgi:hypothetical protein